MFELFATFLGVRNATNLPYKLTRRQQEMEDYLSKSIDRYDLERRERELDRRGY